MNNNDTEVVEYNSFNSELPNDYVNCIASDNSNRIWIGTAHGLAIIDNGVWTLYTIDNSDIPHDAITSIGFDSQGNAWIGASDPRVAQMLLKFDGTTWFSYPAGNSVISVCVDNDDRVWVGLNQGFRLFSNETWTNIGTSGDLWIASRDRGIIKFKGANL